MRCNSILNAEIGSRATRITGVNSREQITATPPTFPQARLSAGRAGAPGRWLRRVTVGSDDPGHGWRCIVWSVDHPMPVFDDTLLADNSVG